jgi:hypothetical protein
LQTPWQYTHSTSRIKTQLARTQLPSCPSPRSTACKAHCLPYAVSSSDVGGRLMKRGLSSRSSAGTRGGTPDPSARIWPLPAAARRKEVAEAAWQPQNAPAAFQISPRSDIGAGNYGAASVKHPAVSDYTKMPAEAANHAGTPCSETHRRQPTRHPQRAPIRPQTLQGPTRSPPAPAPGKQASTRFALARLIN